MEISKVLLKKGKEGSRRSLVRISWEFEEEEWTRNLRSRGGKSQRGIKGDNDIEVRRKGERIL